MNSRFSAIALGAILAVLGAATAGWGQDRIPELQREPTKEPSSETLTGCVARGTAAGTYVLTNITKSGERRMTATESLADASVALSGTDDGISKHVGHRVSVTGRYVSADLVAPVARIDAKQSAAAPEWQAYKKAARTFRISSLAMMSDSCSQTAD